MREGREEKNPQESDPHFPMLPQPGRSMASGASLPSLDTQVNHPKRKPRNRGECRTAVLPNSVNLLALHCKHAPALLPSKYLGEILREEGRLLTALGEADRTGGPTLPGLCREELAGTACGLPARAGRLGELDRTERPEDRGVGGVGVPPGWVTV